ncbi:MAG: putative DNA-binding transcriptional regulator [Bacteroides sp.]|nr:putative DNA-binding transcriptional regulator [Bacteroides sp.]
MANKKDNSQELARVLYMSGMTAEEIADKVGVVRQTVSRWVNTLGWKEMRAASSITRPGLINKVLVSINNLLDKANEMGDDEAAAGLGDKLIKLANAIEKLEKKTSVVDRVDTMIDFENWLVKNRELYPELTAEITRLVNRLHNDYLNEQFSGRKQQ